jgi:aspartate aminotransferase-like enzyme
MAQKTYLLTPGPTPVPERVLTAMARPVIHHRMPAFEDIFRECAAGLARLYGTRGPVLTLAGSGTVGMEAAVVSFCRRADKVLVVDGGKFGERWHKMMRAFGVACDVLTVPWGQAVAVADIEARLAADRSVRAVYCTANESSTGTWHPVDAIAAACRKADDVLCVVDAISCLGAVPLPMDAWGIDVLVTGSQKALMLPPGLAFVAASERAWKRAESADLPRFYCDLLREKKAQATAQTAFTPAVSLIVGLREALAMIDEEGLDQVYARHDRLARATRAAAAGLGCELYSSSPSPTVTAVRGPAGLKTGKLVKHLRDRYGVVIVAGQDEVKDSIFRVAHLGYYSPFDILTIVSALEMGLCDLGVPVARGAGVAAAEAILAAGPPPT